MLYVYVLDKNSQSPVKMKLGLAKLNQQKCFFTYRNFFIEKLILDDSQICAGGKANKNTCRGDSGGPLMARLPNSHNWYLEGIVSFGPKICAKAYPGVYVKVSSYLDWIAKHLKP